MVVLNMQSGARSEVFFHIDSARSLPMIPLLRVGQTVRQDRSVHHLEIGKWMLGGFKRSAQRQPQRSGLRLTPTGGSGGAWC